MPHDSNQRVIKASDFVRPPKEIRLKARPEELAVDLNRTAVIVVDMQNAFVSKGGMFDIFGFDISAGPRLLDNNRKLIDAARKAGCKIVYLMMSYAPDYSDSGGPESPNYYKELAMSMMHRNPEYWGRFVTRGTWDEEICPELTVEPGDHVVRKQRYSGFVGTNLDQILKSYRIKYCIYTGVATNVCVESTLRDGYFREYWPILVSDAVNNAGPAITQEATLWNVEALYGWVTTTADVVTACSGAV